MGSQFKADDERLTTLAHLAISSFSKRQVSSGVVPIASDPCFFLQNLDLLSVREQNSIRTMQNSVLSNIILNICLKDVGKTK